MFLVNTPRLPSDQPQSLLGTRQSSGGSEVEGFIISIRGKISSLFGRQSVDLTHVASFLDPLSQPEIIDWGRNRGLYCQHVREKAHSVSSLLVTLSLT